ncbi:hypothetical protein [Haloparvum sp. AD34]
MNSVRDSLTGHWLADKIVMLLFGLLFGWSFIRAAFPRFGPVDYRALGWAFVSGAFWFAIGYGVISWLGWI